MTRRFLLSFLTLALTLTLSSAADWSRFRGPNGSGVAEGEFGFQGRVYVLLAVALRRDSC